ncbi:phosphoglycerate dehydrogenase [Alicyclobacillus tolerans]|uniref:D-3-phosphoglycerate dehydrogenase n=1 Tax=Alicyclobacillus tolerans TaxID=90970 RepID=A0ABT9LVM8_9BACL|nr:phosphoglycerate dehydrogenase [Alicyclobacillus tengchongensis]MDP9728325.1 D-3-phosphoglycerate dehydrogenase [Alicyclobacillus tengchongensis]
MKVLVTDGISELGVEKLQSFPNIEVIVRPELTPDELLEEIADVDALLLRSQSKITEKVLQAAVQLKVIGRAGVGVDNIDVTAATRRGIVVLNAPDGNTISAAEHTFAMLISLSRHIPQADASIRSGRWDRKKFIGVELAGKTLAVLGMGRIGSEVAKRALAFQMRVIGYDPFLTQERAKVLGVEAKPLEEAIAEADFITVHTPLTKETHHLLNDAAFYRMKRGVRIVNCARGGIIDEQALLRAIEEGIVAGAALDVFEREPLDAHHPLLSRSDVVLTPHLGASTVEAQVNVAIDVAEEVGRVLSGLPFRNAVNLPSLTAEQNRELSPYLELAEKIGLFATQLVPEAPQSIEITYSGGLAQLDVSFLTRTLLKGLLAYHYQDEVNYVNAPIVAEQLHIQVRDVREPKSKVFQNLISLHLYFSGAQIKVAGTLYNGFGPRIVEVDGYAVDAPVEGNMVFTRHVDQPGMIGKMGTLLGDVGINIAGMQVGRRESGGEAIMILSVDKVVPDSVIQQIGSVSGVRVARAIQL